ncbi:MAG: hypothetical protein ACJ8LG_04765 [Massilia sp.]
MPEVALITVHGMGQTPLDYAAPLFDKVRARLRDLGGDVDCRAVYYQGVLKGNQMEVWERCDQNSRLHYAELRKFLLFGFGDAAGLENRKEDRGSVYELAQAQIARQLLAAYEAGNDGAMPVVFLSHSLGCQVLSSYIYDAQRARGILPGGLPLAGIWNNIDAWSREEPGLGRLLTPEEKRFIGAGTCMAWMTTGCNIPVFVAAHKQMHIKPIARPTPNFRWLNIYDPDDALGWPLRPLSSEYAELVEDRAINAGHGMINWLLKSWNPLSHRNYWDDDEVLDPLANMLRLLIA